MRHRSTASHPVAFLLLTLLPLLPTLASAGTHTWTGAAGNTWSNGASWIGGAPASSENGVVLVFPDSAGSRTMTNDVVGLTVASMTFGAAGYSLGGNALTVTNGITVATSAVNGSVTLAVPIALVGPQTLTGEGALLALSGVLSGTPEASLTIAGSKGVSFTKANTFQGSVTVQAPAYLYAQGPSALGASTAGTTVASGATLAVYGPGTFAEPLALAGGSLAGASGDPSMVGPVSLSGACGLSSNEGVTLSIQGTVSGSGSLETSGLGTVRLTGDNGYLGTTTVQLGTLLVDGQQPGSPVIVAGGTLGGTGTTGPVSTNPSVAASVSPGASPGLLTVAGALQLGTFSHLRVELNGTSPGTGYDRIVATSASLGGATLDGSRGSEGRADAPAPWGCGGRSTPAECPSFAAPVGTPFTILATSGTVTGTFAGLPDGASLTIGLQPFQISYGTSSVVLTATGPAPNAPPAITVGSGLSRERGQPSSPTTIGTVSDAETPAGSLVVTVLSAPDGIVVTGLTNSGGTLSATVSATCGAPLGAGSVVLRVDDGTAQSTAALGVTVLADRTAPAVTSPSPSSVTLNQTRCVGGAFGTDLDTLLTRYPAQHVALTALLAGGTATDACTSAPTRLATRLGSVDVTGSTLFPAGTSTVGVRYEDDAGNVGTASATVTVVRQGDLDRSGADDVFDVVILSSTIVGNVQPGVAPFTASRDAADANGDGNVDVFDLVLLAGHVVGNVGCLTP